VEEGFYPYFFTKPYSVTTGYLSLKNYHVIVITQITVTYIIHDVYIQSNLSYPDFKFIKNESNEYADYFGERNHQL